MSKQELTSLLREYLSDEITPERKTELARLIARETDSDELKVSLEEIWNGFEHEQLDRQTSDRLFASIVNSVATEQAQPPSATAIVRPIWKRGWLRVAAILAAAAVTAAIAYQVTKTPANEPHHDAKIFTEAGSPSVRNIWLPDGSQVVLQAGSRLEYPASFDGGKREIQLDGEAWFDIKHDESKPFLIHSGKVTTTVLGTAFTVKAWKDSATITVTVNRGKVRVSEGERILATLTPDEQMSFDTRTLQAMTNTVDAKAVAAWKEQEYQWEDISLRDAVQDLQKRYNAVIILSGGSENNNCPFTASFRYDETLERVLDVICKINNATWTKKEDQYLIQNARCGG
jgi:transmembrane sensor